MWEGGQQRLEKRQRSVVYADRITDTRYVEIARHVAALTQRSPIADRWTLTVDATGVGRAFVDVLTEFDIAHMPVQMVGGTSITRAGHHADMAIAAALAWFRSEQSNGFVGEGQLEGWF